MFFTCFYRTYRTDYFCLVFSVSFRSCAVWSFFCVSNIYSLKKILTTEYSLDYTKHKNANPFQKTICAELFDKLRFLGECSEVKSNKPKLTQIEQSTNLDNQEVLHRDLEQTQVYFFVEVLHSKKTKSELNWRQSWKDKTSCRGRQKGRIEAY